MKTFKLVLISVFCLCAATGAFSQQYPLIFIGANVGYGWNEEQSALAIKAHLRYSLEANIPGLQVEASYSANLFNALEKTEETYDDGVTSGTRINEFTASDHQLSASAAFHLPLFGKSGILYLGGGGNVNFLGVDSTFTDKYWDPVSEKGQEKKEDPVELLQEVVLGYHALAGLRFRVGAGSVDIEVRKTFITLADDAWQTAGAREKYGDKDWGAWSVNLGFTFNVW